MKQYLIGKTIKDIVVDYYSITVWFTDDSCVELYTNENVQIISTDTK